MYRCRFFSNDDSGAIGGCEEFRISPSSLSSSLSLSDNVCKESLRLQRNLRKSKSSHHQTPEPLDISHVILNFGLVKRGNT